MAPLPHDSHENEVTVLLRMMSVLKLIRNQKNSNRWWIDPNILGEPRQRTVEFKTRYLRREGQHLEKFADGKSCRCSRIGHCGREQTSSEELSSGRSSFGTTAIV